MGFTTIFISGEKGTVVSWTYYSVIGGSTEIMTEINQS